MGYFHDSNYIFLLQASISQAGVGGNYIVLLQASSPQAGVVQASSQAKGVVVQWSISELSE